MSVSGCWCNGPCGGQPQQCTAGEVTTENVDCYYCCKLSGQTCTQQEQATTLSKPCCSGVCGDAGVCTCSGENEACATTADCCSGVCDSSGGRCAKALDGGA